MRITKYIKKYRNNRNKYLRYKIHDISENTCVYIYCNACFSIRTDGLGPGRHANPRQVRTDEVQEAHLGEW